MYKRQRLICQFVEDIPKIIDIIRQRDGHDIKIVEERDYITNKKESGYRSYHVVIKYGLNTAFGFKEVLAEIQIRTLAMNFWAVTEHELNYKSVSYTHLLLMEEKHKLQLRPKPWTRLEYLFQYAAW